MEGGSSIGTWLAYALIVLFWGVVAALVARTTLMISLLLLMPLRRAARRITRWRPG